MLFEEGEYYTPSEIFSCINGGPSSMMMMKKNKMMNKRRFSDEQVKSLESIFENETKLEPKKKVQLARELGLEPRQVAIWFQNKRARYKSRQLERDYTILRANYDALASQFDVLKKEKQSLLSQLQKLKDLVEKDEKNNNNKEDSNKKSSESETEKRQEEWEEEQKPALSLSVEGSEYGTSSIMSSDEGSSGGNARYLVGETDQIDMDILAAMVPGPVVADGGSMAVPTEAGWDDEGLRHDEGLFDLQGGDSGGQWWDFWSC